MFRKKSRNFFLFENEIGPTLVGKYPWENQHFPEEFPPAIVVKRGKLFNSFSDRYNELLRTAQNKVRQITLISSDLVFPPPAVLNESKLTAAPRFK